MVPTEKTFAGNILSDRSLMTERRAGIAVFIAFLFPTLIAMGLLAVDAVRAYSQASLVNFATQMAALAGGSTIGDYYSQGATKGSASIGHLAAVIGDANAASSANLSAVIQSTTLGNWDPTHATFTSLATSGSTAPNAVLVIGQTTMSTYFGGAFGTPTITITKSATATLGTPKAFNAIVLNDMGGPNPNQSLGIPGSAQANWWSQQQAADLAILKCIKSAGNTASNFGVTGFVEQAYVLQALTSVNSGTNATTIGNNINNVGSSNFQYCRESKAAHMCHGSNVVSAIDAAIAQFSGAAYAGASNNIVILTNELPVYDPAAVLPTNPAVVYTTAMGTGVTVGPGIGPAGVTLAGSGGSAVAWCGASPVCTATNLKQMAEGQSVAAGQAVTSGRAGIVISTVYFSGDASTPAGSATAYATEIASWAKNGGIVLTTSSLNDVLTGGTVTTPGVATQAGKVCKMIGATLQLTSS